jgi:HlyD family secretion protein
MTLFRRRRAAPPQAPSGAMPKEWYADVPRSTRTPTLFGFTALALSLLGFGVWGSTAPIAGAVVTSGVFVATGQNKIVQHLEGGIIRDILVREGDLVDEGQPLIELDDTSAKAELRRLVLRRARLSAIEARLLAEIRMESQIAFPEELVAMAKEDRDIGDIIEAQRLTFEARLNSERSEISTLRAGIDALNERIAGGNTQLEAVRKQLTILQEELDGKTQLLKGGLIRKPEVLAVQRASANLQGEVGRLMGDIGDSKERIARIDEQILGVRNAAVKAAVEQLHEVHGEANDLRERMRAARGILDRIRIVAPTRGVVVKMRYHTPGGVVEAGKSVLELVPASDSLIIEVRVRPQDVDNVKVGQKAIVRLSALSQRVTPMVAGNVIYLSADALPDEKSSPAAPRDLYVARVSLDPADIKHIHDFEPTPGMPAEVYIKTGERTFLEYLLQPVRDSMSRAFRES